VANVTSGAEAVPARPAAPARGPARGSGPRPGPRLRPAAPAPVPARAAAASETGGQEAGWKVLASTVNTGSSLAHSACGVDQYSA
jgi:hypothetical protein